MPPAADRHADPTASGGRPDLGEEAVYPEDDGYAEARGGWNVLYHGRPAAVVRCSTPAEVAAAVRKAAERGLRVTARSGGHDYAGRSSADGALLLDLSSMDGVLVDARRRSARVRPGATWAAFDAAAQEHGLATPGPTVSTVGVGGSTLGGGLGWLSRKHGLTLDNLSAAEVVTAEGEVVRASAEENPELFWGLRGAGAHLGIVTELELDLHAVGPDVVLAQAFHPFEDAADVLRAFRGFMAGAPDEVQAFLFVLRTPPVEPFPERFHGQLTAAVFACWVGAAGEGEEVLRPLIERGEPFLSAISGTPYVTLQQSFDAGTPGGQRWYSRARGLGDLDDAAVEAFVTHAGRLAGPFSMAYLGMDSGAVARVDPGATAYPHRQGGFGLHILAGWPDPAEDDQNIGWARDFHAALADHAEPGAYVHLLSGDEEDAPREAWGPNLPRLRELKRRWDPDGLFAGGLPLGG